MSDALATLAELPISRDRDRFLRELLLELAETLENVVGEEEASGFVRLVGMRMGDVMDREYCEALGRDRLDRDQVAAALVDLKQRIEGGFRIESVDDDRIVLVNDRCPFGREVEGHPSLCEMTSSVFGRLTARNLGYAAVTIEQAIARGDAGCRVVIALNPDAESGNAHTYYGE